MLKRSLGFIAAFLLSVMLSACGGSNANMVETPANMMMQRGRNYKEVIEDFEDKGFTNIKTEPIEDLEYDWSFKNGQVEQISVGGDTNYDAGVRVPEDTQVIIRYHTYNPDSAKDKEEDSDGKSDKKSGGKNDSKDSEEKPDSKDSEEKPDSKDSEEKPDSKDSEEKPDSKDSEEKTDSKDSEK